MLEQVYDANNLYKAFANCRKTTGFKESVQRYGINILLNILDLQKQFAKSEYKSDKKKDFILRERGHVRCITAFSIKDRVVQRSFNDNILSPILKPLLIYDNAASQIGKGQTFALKRVRKMVQEAYRKYGKNAYVVQLDVSKYFDNLRHDVAGNFFERYVDKDTLGFIKERLAEFEPDVSYMTDAEYEQADKGVYNSLLQYTHLKGATPAGAKRLRKSMCIGSQLSQNIGISYTHRIDAYSKCVLGLKYYVRYMDDTLIILPGKAEAVRVVKLLTEQYKKVGLHINRKKTRIAPLIREFIFLKIRHIVRATGRLIRIPVSETYRRERRRIRKFARLVMRQGMTIKHMQECYSGWRGTYAKYAGASQMRRTDNCLYQSLQTLKGGIDHGR